MSTKNVYFFGDRKADGDSTMKNLLGGKGANLAEMNLIGIPVPAGFTITTEVCNYYVNNGEKATIELLQNEVKENLAKIEAAMGSKFGDVENPLLLSVRSGARVSMPGMMDTVLNLGLNNEILEGLIKKTNNARFAWDSYRRFIQMYSNVVMNVNAADDSEHDPFEAAIDHLKEERNLVLDTDFSADDLKELTFRFKAVVKERTGHDFPDNPWDQLWGGVMAVFNSWEGKRAVVYRNLNRIPHDWGTAVNVQAMVYGNMGASSATGVAFSRNSSTGENLFNGEFLVNAQGEDVVAGIRTPQEITKLGSQRWAELAGVSEVDRVANALSLEEYMPEQYKELHEIQLKLETYYKDMQDIEFTIQENKLWMLQTRSGKRTGRAMVKIAMDMKHEGLITEKEALLRIDAGKLDELLHPEFDKEALRKTQIFAKGLAASPGAATGQVVFTADDAVAAKKDGRKVILVRVETSPEDIAGMDAAEGILTARGGMTSHAAVVARGMGKCCVSGAGSIKVDYKTKMMEVDGIVIKEGDWISLNGSTGDALLGKIETTSATIDNDFREMLDMADKYAVMKVRTNADTPHDSQVARDFGAQGIGLCRTEHMFFEGEKIIAMREMILADDEAGRRLALAKLLPIQRKDFEGIFEAMKGLPVTVRLLDPPLHEFVPHDAKGQEQMAQVMGISVEKVKQKVEELSEFNPMLGHRGCRLGNTYPEISEMQTRAIIEAALNLKARGIEAKPEIMIPLTGTLAEMQLQEQIVRDTIKVIFAERKDEIHHLVGTMIEVPRAALVADQIATSAEFFSFGTNDLTQMTFGYSRDDAGKFLPVYIEKGILKRDPFEVLDQEGVGQLIKMACERGKQTRPDIKLGICGEHGGEPSSIEFCHKVGLNYVSCSPYRVPIARLVAGQAAVK
ncbi:MAG: pyruvate, phosphate dikinase [Flavobacteriaceae bacterium]|jgi:pyruvate,orthophosphate dikinase|nr:pyruvate, phosphate dikinase [Flavobacteriaceae bacterium]